MNHYLLRNVTMASSTMKYLLLVSLLLTSLTKSVSAQFPVDQIICPGNLVYITCTGASVEVDYTTPYFSNPSAAPSVKVTRIEGPASGSAFPVGVTRITYEATWLCQPVPPTHTCTETCTFTVTVVQQPGAMFYRDWDGDGYAGNIRPDSVFQCAGIYYPGWSQILGDCDDGDPLVYRSTRVFEDHDGDGYTKTMVATEVCWGDTWPEGLAVGRPGFDGFVDDTKGLDCDDHNPLFGAAPLIYFDNDKDGYTDGFTRPGCVDPRDPAWTYDPGRGPDGSLLIDCNDFDSLEHPNQVWYPDNDGDHHGQGFLAGGPLNFPTCTRPAGNWFARSELISILDCNDNDPTINPETIWFLDADNDGYSDGTSLVQCERLPHYKLAKELTTISADCNDSDPTINPETIWYIDNDHDGYHNASVAYAPSCTPPFPNFNSRTTKGPDCNDNDPAINLETIWILDADRDDYYTGDPVTQCTLPGPGYIMKVAQHQGDCNDNDPAINPGTTWFLDFDGDGYHNPATIGFPSCTPPGPNYKLTTRGPDCNDNDGAVHAPVQYYVDSDKDGYGSTATAMLCSSVAPVGYSTNNTDCNDNNNAIHPGATEVCDGIDNDCDGLVDEGVKSTFYRDADGDGYGNPLVTTQACVAPTGYVSNNTDCSDNIIAIHPGATEVCDGIDNDCDGLVDEGVKSTFYKDADGDGYGNPVVTTQACAAPTGYVANNTDCSDNDPSINPGAVEVCGNKKDDNCNGVVDESVCYACQNATNLKVTSITSNSAQVSWSAMANPVQWQLQYKTTNKGSKWVDVLLTGNLRTYKLTPLSSNQNYQVQIRAKCGNTWTSYSAAQSFKTLSSTTASVASAQPLPEEISGSSPGLKLYPNPNNGQFVIQLSISNEPDGNAKIQMVDVLGRIVHTEHANLSSGKLQKTVTMPSQVTRGVYMLRIIVNDKAYQTKLIYQ
jgi:hypothetical protein